MNFNQALKEKIDEIDQQLEGYFVLTNTSPYEDLINEAMRYSLLNGGKRIRPIILLEMTRILGGDTNEGIALASAIEMIHTYSLIHDDLPSMDDDDIRRGKAANHIKFGEDIATLAGDGLLNGAFELMFNEVLLKEPTVNKVHACREIAKASGHQGMILGQVADIKTEIRTEESLDYINKHKTGALIEAAFTSAGYLSNSDQIEKLRIIGQNLGRGFQIQDDVLDVIGNEKELGKPIGSDQKNNKKTYVDLLGIEGAIDAYEKCYENCIVILEKFENSEFLIALVNYLLSRKH